MANLVDINDLAPGESAYRGEDGLFYDVPGVGAAGPAVVASIPRAGGGPAATPTTPNASKTDSPSTTSEGAAPVGPSQTPGTSGCGCPPPKRSSLWTSIPGNRISPDTPIPGDKTHIQPGENMDCYMKRSSEDGPKDDARIDLTNRIQNTSITADGTLRVQETFTLSQGPRAATSWTMTPTIPGLFFNTTTGVLSGTVDTTQESVTFKITITARDAEGEIDSRQFTFSPNKPTKGTSLSFVQPYVPSSGSAKITSGFGPRKNPFGGGEEKAHKGQDWVASAAASKGKGKIVAAADGEVVSVENKTSGYGKNVKINHLGADGKVIALTLYGHLSEILVSKGQKVSAGQMIGKEGSTGASTGAHLHFEVRLGGTVAVNPTPYLNGTIIETPPVQADGSTLSDRTRTNTASTVTANEVAARTGTGCGSTVGSTNPTTSESTVPPTDGYDSPVKATCVPPVDQRLTREQTLAKINEALETYGATYGLTAEDKKIILFMARIESGYDTYAKNPTSSALGLYQMIDSTARKYYEVIGVPFTCENRVNPLYATQAMIRFYTREEKAYYTEFHTLGTLAGKTIVSTAHSARYMTLTQAEFEYGLIHHDGVGNAVKGIDKGGVKYFREKASSFSYA